MKLIKVMPQPLPHISSPTPTPYPYTVPLPLSLTPITSALTPIPVPLHPTPYHCYQCPYPLTLTNVTSAHTTYSYPYYQWPYPITSVPTLPLTPFISAPYPNPCPYYPFLNLNNPKYAQQIDDAKLTYPQLSSHFVQNFAPKCKRKASPIGKVTGKCNNHPWGAGANPNKSLDAFTRDIVNQNVDDQKNTSSIYDEHPQGILSSTTLQLDSTSKGFNWKLQKELESLQRLCAFFWQLYRQQYIRLAISRQQGHRRTRRGGGLGDGSPLTIFKQPFSGKTM